MIEVLIEVLIDLLIDILINILINILIDVLIDILIDDRLSTEEMVTSASEMGAATARSPFPGEIRACRVNRSGVDWFCRAPNCCVV